ncbi:S1 family peptidase [Luteococcus peritonei]|uniref:S1 family peptidase n=1 Tax=Luteococcus peritonei TaxID=88874 RepID=A0ABW4RVZ0_9ACTN
MNKSIVTTAILGLVALPVLGASPAHADADYRNPSTYEEAMVGYAMATRHLTEAQAKQHLARQASQQATLDKLQASGITVDGSYLDADNQLVAVLPNGKHAATVRQAGLGVRIGHGAAALQKKADRIATAHRGKAYVASVMPDITTGKVQVTLTDQAPSSLARSLKADAEVSVVSGRQNSVQADVLAGQDMIMPLNDGSNRMSACSNGFMGTQSNGNTVMLTAGHCIENTSLQVTNSEGVHVGSILHTRFHTGQASIDMGLVDIDADDTPYGWVDSRGFDGYYAVKGMSKNAVGTQLCKSGRTTGWTCGSIKGYGTSVNYGNGTTASGLMTTTVCTEQGDSGGAYIGVGDLAQGMTSGGPTQQSCGGYNTGYTSSGTSYVQPVVDAANYYGVKLILAN